MIRLLKLELLKNLNYRPFKIFTGIYFAILFALLFIGLIDFDLFGQKVNLKEQGIYDFPGIWNFTTYIVALLKIFLGMIIIFSITQEFTNRMFKQNTIDGLSRAEFVGSKVITISLFSIISTIVVFAVTLYLGYQYSESTETSLVSAEMYFIATYFLKLFAFFSFLMFLSILLRKSIFVFLAIVIWWILEAIMGGVESFFRIKDFNNKTEVMNSVETFYFSKLLPLESMSSIVPNPLMRLKVAKMMGVQYKFQFPTESLIACIIWATIFIIGSYWILKKRDW